MLKKEPTAQQTALALRCLRIKKMIQEVYNSVGIPSKYLDTDKIFSPIQVRNAIIRQAFNKSRVKKIKAEYLYFKLAKEYDLSAHTIRDIVHERR